MKKFVIVLGLLTGAVAGAQVPQQSFTVVEADAQTSFTGARIVMRDNAVADVFYVESRSGEASDRLQHVIVSVPDQQMTAGPEELPCISEWDVTIADVLSRGVAGWAALIYETTRWQNGVTGRNRTRLIWGDNLLSEAMVLDSGTMPYIHPHNGDHTNKSLSLRARQGGGCLAAWIHEGTNDFGRWSDPACTARVVTFDGQMSLIGDQFFAGGQVSPWGPQGVQIVSWSPDTVLALLSCETDVFLNWVPRAARVPDLLSLGCKFAAVRFDRTAGRRLFALPDRSPVYEVNAAGECKVLCSTGLYDRPTFAAWHSNWGYVFLRNYAHTIMLSRVDTLGRIVQPAGLVYDSGPERFIAHSSAAIAPNGRIAVLWGERAAADTACIALKMTWIGWTEYLDVSDRELIAHPSSFLLSCSPNPFNARTEIRFVAPAAGNVSLDLFDVAGRKVIAVVNEPFAAGEHVVQVNGSRLAAGVYFATIHAAGRTATQKILLLK